MLDKLQNDNSPMGKVLRTGVGLMIAGACIAGAIGCGFVAWGCFAFVRAIFFS